MLWQTLKRSRRSAEARVPRGLPSKARSAAIWYESSPQGWNRIAREVLAARLDVGRTPDSFALLNLAMADGYIAGFDSKYYYNYWRPVTAIREGGAKRMAELSFDPAGTGLPLDPYGGRGCGGYGDGPVLQHRLHRFSMTSGAPYPGITRKFWSFSEAARENGASRVLCGIHFSTAVNAGYIQGERIGEWAFE